MANPIPIFKASTGLNTQLDPTRLIFDPETGITDLAVAYNVDHDYSGRISRRKGFSATAITDDCHSLFCEGGDCLLAIGATLCLVPPDLSTYRSLTTITAGAPVSYCQVADTIYWMTGFEKGFVRNGENNEWVKGSYYGPTSQRTLSDPPLGTIVRAHAGRIYIVVNDLLVYSDPYSLNAFDLVRGFFHFEGPVSMVRPVSEGMFVGTDEAVFFLQGGSPKTFKPIKAARTGAFKGTDVYVDLSELSPKEFLQNRTGEAVLWTGVEGVSIGMPDGQVFHLTKDRLAPLEAVEGAGAVINGRYVCTLAP